MGLLQVKKKKVLLILVIIGIIVLFLVGYFLSKKLNDFNNKIQNNEQLKEDKKNDIHDNNNLSIENDSINDNKENLDDNNSSEIITNDNQIKNDKKEENKTNVNNDNRNNISSNNDKNEEIIDKEISSKFELKSLGDLQYYLYTPSNPTNDMPLIMYLHGGTNKKLDVQALLTTDGFPKYLYDGYYSNLRAYVVIPKLANNYIGWVDISNELRNLIKVMNADYQINLNKVSLTGHSMGGTGTYQVQVKLSNTFACIAPMSGSIKNTEENISSLSKTKIWAFVGTNDTIINPNSTRTIIETLKSNGANVRLTEFDGVDHFGVPSLGYKNSEFINWLVNCSK